MGGLSFIGMNSMTRPVEFNKEKACHRGDGAHLFPSAEGPHVCEVGGKTIAVCVGSVCLNVTAGGGSFCCCD